MGPECDWSVLPSLGAALKSEGLDVMEPVGVSYNPFKDMFFISSDSGVNYLMGSVKPA